MYNFLQMMAALLSLGADPTPPAHLVVVPPNNESCFSETEQDIAVMLQDSLKVVEYVKAHQYHIVENLTKRDNCELVPPGGSVMNQDEIDDLAANDDIYAVRLVEWSAKRFNVNFARLYIAVVLNEKVGEIVSQSPVVKQIFGSWESDQANQ